MITSFFEQGIIIIKKDFLLLPIAEIRADHLPYSLIIAVVRAKKHPVFAQAMHCKFDHPLLVVASTDIHKDVGLFPDRKSVVKGKSVDRGGGGRRKNEEA